LHHSGILIVKPENKINNAAFTIIETIIAAALIFIIISAVYGTYFAASLSVERCNQKIDISQQARSLLSRISRQLRTAWPGPAYQPSRTIMPISTNNIINTPEPSDYFSAPLKHKEHIILRLVTTAPLFTDELTPQGLFRATYRFEPRTHTLLYHQQRYINQNHESPVELNWHPLAHNIESIQLSFYDGRQWQPQWRYSDNNSLPRAVKIIVTFHNDNNNQTIAYSTLAYVNCH